MDGWNYSHNCMVSKGIWTQSDVSPRQQHINICQYVICLWAELGCVSVGRAEVLKRTNGVRLHGLGTRLPGSRANFTPIGVCHTKYISKY